MDIKTQMTIKNNPILMKFLRENSNYYKLLNRNGNYIIKMEQEMKEKYHMRVEDKLEDFSKKIDTVNNFFKIIN